MSGIATERPAVELVQELLRAFKVRRLYDPGHPRREEVGAASYARIGAILDATGPVQLSIGETTLSCGDEVVYRHPAGGESLAFLLYREGLRRLSFFPGLAAGELSGFLDHLIASTRAGEGGDLVARLWEERLVHLRYVFVESLSDREWIPPAVARASGPAGGNGPIRLAEDDRGVGVPQVDLEAPPSHYQLDDADLAALRDELDEANERELVFDALSCIRELLLDPIDDDSTPLLAAVAEVQAGFLQEGDTVSAQRLHAIFEPYLAGDRVTPQVREAFRRMRRTALGGDTLPRLVVRLEAGDIEEAEVAAFCRAFGQADLEALLEGVPDLKLLCQRPLLAETFVSLADADLEALGRVLATGVTAAACGAAYLAGVVADPRLVPALGRALERVEPEVRREALVALKHIDDGRSLELVAGRVDDPDPAIRLYALRYIVSHRYTPALERIEELVDDGAAGDRPRAEQRLLYEAYGALGGLAVVERLGARLAPPRGLFRRVDPDEVDLALVGLAATRTRAAREIVGRAARDRHRAIREPARRVLESWPGALDGQPA